jgi:uncharacterized protein (TIGR03000 family)
MDMMRKLLIAVAALALMLDASMVSAARCGRGHCHRGGHGCAPAACATCAPASACAAAPACSGGVCAIAAPGGYALAEAADGTATVLVELPADATLTVDGVATTSTSTNRVFVTPPLENGQTFHYTLTAQVVRDGQTQTVTRQVAVRAGEETRVTLDVPAAAVAVR